MSDSILYLAIVAIWAGFLIPAWVRRPHSAKAEQEYDTVEFEIEIDSETDRQTAADAGTRPEPATRAPFRDRAEAGYQAFATAFSPAPTADLDTDVPDDITGTNSEYRDDVHPHNYAEPGPSRRRRRAGRPGRRRAASRCCAPAAGCSPSWSA